MSDRSLEESLDRLKNNIEKSNNRKNSQSKCKDKRCSLDFKNNAEDNDCRTIESIENRGQYTGLFISKADWRKLNAKHVILNDCKFINVDLTESNLEGLQASNCDFFDSCFEKVDLTDSKFKNCRFYNKETTKGCRFSHAKLHGVDFKASNISNCEFTHADMFQCEIENCQAQGANFSYVDFSRRISRAKIMAQVILKNSNFRYASFEGVYLEGCDLSESLFVNVDFSNAMLDKCDFSNATFSSCVLHGASIAGVDFRNADITGLNILEINASGIKIFEWQQSSLLDTIGIIVYPDKT